VILPPILLHYYITERCNCQCSFCSIWKSSSPAADAATDDVLTNLKNARQLGVRYVDFTGGEPLLHPQLHLLLRQAKRLGFKTTITTNTLLYPQLAESLKGLIDFLHFSLDSLDENQHNTMRGCQTYNSVMESIRIIQKLSEKADLLCTISEKNIHQLPQLVKFARSLRMMLIVNPVFSYSGSATIDPALLSDVDAFAAHPFVYVNKAFHRLRRRGGNQTGHPRCRVIDSTIVISPQNEIILPCFHCGFCRIPLAISSNHRPAVINMAPPGWQQRISASMNDHQARQHHRNPIKRFRESETFRLFKKMQGRFSFCSGCHINCYFDPSFVYQPDEYMLLSLQAKARYAFYKYVYNLPASTRLFSQQGSTR